VEGSGSGVTQNLPRGSAENSAYRISGPRVEPWSAVYEISELTSECNGDGSGSNTADTTLNFFYKVEFAV
jgi:hypothetical protein